MTTLPKDFEWRQSTVSTLLRCPRRFKLEHVQRLKPDLASTGYAALIGSAAHVVAAEILLQSNRQLTPTSVEIGEHLQDAFTNELSKAFDDEQEIDPEGMDRAQAKLTVTAARLCALALDPRIRHVYWTEIERSFRFKVNGRIFKGTLDAAGTCLRPFTAWSMDGREPVHLSRGDRVLGDWKNGDVLHLNSSSRANNIQLALYALAMRKQVTPSASEPVITFIGALRDLDPVNPSTQGIPKRLKGVGQVNPKWAKAMNLTETEALTSRARLPKSGPALPKWLDDDGNATRKKVDRLNPEWIAGQVKPKGPLLRHCRVNQRQALQTVADAIRMAESNLFPASGALTGECAWCPFRTQCN